MAFVVDRATMSTIWYFENHVDYHTLCKTEGSKQKFNSIKLNFSMRNSVAIALKYMINNGVLK